MYEKLAKRLREPCPYTNCVLCKEAADAIETLIGKVKYLIERCDMADKNCSEAAHLGAMWKEAALERMPSWIPVKKQLPEKNGKYLCNVKRFGLYAEKQYYYVDVLVFQENCFFEDGIGTERVTHWMPLPEPPKEE